MSRFKSQEQEELCKTIKSIPLGVTFGLNELGELYKYDKKEIDESIDDIGEMELDGE